MAQERSQVGQLHNVWSTFNAKAHPNCWESAEECDKKVDGDLKSVIKAYFGSKKDATQTELEALSSARKKCEFIQSVIAAEEPVNWDAIARDIRSFITSHGDLELSGRAIARVFHGIDSPCFPASVWGRERRYWRRHLDVDFNSLRKCATKELVKFR
jgi:ATP-dependent DNA helicase Q4